MALTDTLRVRTSLARHLKQAGKTDDERVKELIAAAAVLLLGLTQKLSAGSITMRGFIFQSRSILSGHMQQAAALSAGDAFHPGAVNALLESKLDYLDGFATDLATGAISEAQAAARAGLWSGLVHTAYQVGKVLALSDDAKAEIYWTAEGDEGTCAQCDDLAAGSPYRLDELPTYPGMGDTSCLSACRCSVDAPGGE